MIEVNLTKEISNDDGYVDQVVSAIKAVPAGDPLHMLITCVGGDTFQGARLQRAVLEHEGRTKATVIGLAASMAGVLLAAFDEVEIDSEAEIMLHKAHIPGMADEEYTPEQRKIIQRFNERSYNLLMSMGVDEKFLNDVFLSDEAKDHWLTADEAQAYGLGKVNKVTRKDSEPLKIAAKLQSDQLKQIKMGLFTPKNKAVPRLLNLSDGKVLLFNSETEELKKGDIVQLVGSNESLKGTLRISDKVVATIGENNEVTDMEEVEEDEDNKFEERLKNLESAIAQILEKLNATPDEGAMGAEAKAELEKKEEEVEAKLASLEDAHKTATALLENAMKVAANIKSEYKLPKFDDKNEPLMAKMESAEERAISMREAIKAKKSE